MYNFVALISYHVKNPKNKRINFAKAIHSCHQYFKDKLLEKVLLEITKNFIPNTP